MRQLHGFHTSVREYPKPSTQGDFCDVFVKLGGSILDNDVTTAELVPYITALARQHRILILPGGGQVVKRIKAKQSEHGTDFHSCWIAAVLCLEVNAGILASYSTSFTVVSSAAEISACFEAGNVAVFAPAGSILSSLHLTPNWQPTTDSMGLYFANVLGARRYVIVSDVHGIYESKPDDETCMPPISQLSVDELERLSSSKLDPVFPSYFRRYALSTVVVNGRHPSRVSAAICGNPTVCTEIRVPCREGALS